MATGYLLKVIPRLVITTATNTNLFTVPSGHIYMVKNIQGSLLATGGGSAASVKFQVSDNAGANFKDLTPVISTAATASATKFFNLGPPGVADAAPSTTTGTVYAASILGNLMLEAGQILRAVTTVGSEIDVYGSVIDYTI